MKTAFDFIKPPEKTNKPPLVKYSTMEALLVEIEKANAENFDYLKVSDLSVLNVQSLMHDYFFDVNCTGYGVCIVRWRGYSLWVAYENDQPVAVTGGWLRVKPCPASATMLCYRLFILIRLSLFHE